MFKELTTKDIYHHPQDERYEKIVSEFNKRFGTSPDFITRAPGRVNLIGEHIDYEGYGVLPFAIEKDCVIAIVLCDSKTIQIKHFQQNKYPDQTISSDVKESPKYDNVYVRYFYAGYEAAIRQVSSIKNLPKEIQQRLNNSQYQGMKVLIEGNVPKGSGLSSSSSLCVCSALATLRANKLEKLVNKEDFISQVIKYQRLVGTAIGGMDQSISVLGKNGSALYIEFNPIKGTVVHLPKNYVFVITNSMQESNKLQTLGKRYNKRVCQCYMAVVLLAKRLSIPKEQGSKLKTFKDLQEYCKLPLQDMLLIVDKFLDNKQYQKEELEQLFGPLNDFLKDIPNSEVVIKTDQTYSLYNAAKHVYSQAYRVLQFVNICNSNLGERQKGILLGKLMNLSQDSCRDTYKCSSKLLDTLTQLALKEGAVGSRLTGAGWGGCAVSMIQQSKVKDFIDNIKEKYYNLPEFSEKVKQQGVQNLIFQTAPAEGASFIALKSK